MLRVPGALFLPDCWIFLLLPLLGFLRDILNTEYVWGPSISHAAAYVRTLYMVHYARSPKCYYLSLWSLDQMRIVGRLCTLADGQEIVDHLRFL